MYIFGEILLRILTYILYQTIGINTIGRWIQIFSFCVLIQMGYDKQGVKFIKKISILMQILVRINFAIKIIYPNGLAQTETYGNYIHFLANKNGLTPIYFMFSAMLFTEYSNSCSLSNKKKLYMILIALTIIPFNSGTSTLCCSLIIIIIIILSTENKIIKSLTYAKAWIIYIISS